MNARRELLDRLVSEQHNGGGWTTPPRVWNAEMSTAALTFNDDDVTRARRRRELLDAAGDGDVEEAG